MDRSDFIVFLHKIPPEGLQLSWVIAESRLAGMDLAIPLQGPIAAEFKVERFGHEIHVNGEVRGTFLLECSRCLRSFPQPFQGEVQATFAPPSKADGDETHELTAEELEVAPLIGGGADLRGLIAEQIHLALPIQPLCSRDCRGICPHCGRDLALGACVCAPEGGEPRWEALKKLAIKG